MILALCAMAALLGACGKKAEGGGPVTITITMEDGGVIKAELYPDKAPNTVNNFISLANSGYFDGKVFHRGGAGFVIQGGSPNGDGTSVGFPYSIKGEFAANGFTGNADLKHVRGALSMARIPGRNDSASCQFFIMHGDSPGLDGDYATFGKVVSGMEVVDKIANSPNSGSPAFTLNTPVAMKSVKVDDLNGWSFTEPVTIPA